MVPLVSILIPAYNAQAWIAETIRSALAQTWSRREIIVVDDGSKDQTFEVARGFASRELRVVRKSSEGAAATRNAAFGFCQGDYIQWLDADDLLAPDKIERQLKALRNSDSDRILLSCPWAYFMYRPHRAKFTPTAVWQDLAPVDWLIHKMTGNLHMQTATWLTSRTLAEAAGPWDTRLLSDDDGEYFCRVLLASDGVRFVPEGRVLYRITGSGRLSSIGMSDRKKEAMLLSMQLHIKYLRSLEESTRVRTACVKYLHTWLPEFYPERMDLVRETEKLAEELGGHLSMPRLRWKYAWMAPLVGWRTAKKAQVILPQIKANAVRCWDRACAAWSGAEGGGGIGSEWRF